MVSNAIPFRIYRSGGLRYLSVSTNRFLKLGRTGLGTSLYRLKRATLDEETEVNLVIENPAVGKAKAFRGNLKLIREYWLSYAMTRDVTYRRLFFFAVFSAMEYFNPKELRNYNLRDIAKLIGVKSMRTYYGLLWIEGEAQFKDRDQSLKRAKDTTLVQQVSQMRKYWPQVYGFSKRFDDLLKRELKLYLTALKSRGLSIETHV